MPRSRLLSICIVVSLVLHLVATIGLILLPSGKRPTPDVVPVELADLPRATDYLEPAPGIVQGAPPPEPKASPVPPPPARTIPPPPAKAIPPQGRVPDLPVNPELPPQKEYPLPKGPEPPPQGKEGAGAGDKEKAAQAQEKPAAGSAVEKPSPAAPQPDPTKQAPGNSASSLPAAQKALKDLMPKLGSIVRPPGEPGGRRDKPNSGSAVSTEGTLRDKGQIAEESGGGVHLSSLSSPEIQYLSWYDSVRRKIELVWVYPLEAAQAGMQGEVTIDFVIERNGSVSSVRIVRGSGFKVLDDEAVRAIQVVGRARFNPIPKSYNVPNLPIRGRFMYVQGGFREIR